jgi:SAM-dependent methyltransferase
VFEEFVTHIRWHLLDELVAPRNRFTKGEYIALASALSHYALFTDFILDETEEERKRIDALRHRIETDRETAARAEAIAIFACYRPLHLLTNAKDILEAFENDEMLADVVQAQIADHVSLCEMAATIPSIAPVADETSLRVREQYEGFPYPRWKTFSKRLILEGWQAEEISQRIESSLRDGHPRMLIAGCGTGRDAAIHAVRFPGASITAVDISRASLAYAAIKAREHDLRNIAFLHGDILSLGRLGQSFDYICCAGVLHHMEDPVAGWGVLCDLLRPGGLMRIGLYSSAGRKAIVAAQETARRGNYPPTREGILRFRRECPSLCDAETLRSLLQLKDYYHMNMYRDLLFPAKEHRFDLPRIRDILGRLGLSFEGFYLSDDVLANYRSMFPHDRGATNLEYWSRFESRYPETFASMYVFWCRKAPAGLAANAVA